jgi:hypothetical protein
VLEHGTNAIPGLTSLRTVGSIFSNGGTVKDLSPLVSLVQTTGDVYLQQTPIEVLGMNALVEIGGDLELRLAGFPLTAWNGFSDVARVAGDVIIRGNNSLPSAAVRTWVVNVDVGGRTEICENLGGASDACDEQEQPEG